MGALEKFLSAIDMSRDGFLCRLFGFLMFVLSMMMLAVLVRLFQDHGLGAISVAIYPLVSWGTAQGLYAAWGFFTERTRLAASVTP